MARVQTEERVYIPKYIRKDVYDENKGICAHCGKHMDYDAEFTVDHIIPLSKGGTNERENYIALCDDCNKDKNSDILSPARYYQYATNSRRKQIEARMQEYIRTTNWLEPNNLFPMDRFTIRSNGYYYVKRGKQRVLTTLPVTMAVEKQTTENAFKWLQEYKRKLLYRDHELIVSDIKEIETPYYLVSYKGKPYYLFSAYINAKYYERTHVWSNVLGFDVFVHPDIKPGNATELTLGNNIFCTICQISTNLKEQCGQFLLKLYIRTAKSDTVGVNSLDCINKNTTLYMFTEEDNLVFGKTGGITYTKRSLMSSGPKEIIRKLVDELNDAEPKECYANNRFNQKLNDML